MKYKGLYEEFGEAYARIKLPESAPHFGGMEFLRPKGESKHGLGFAVSGTLFSLSFPVLISLGTDAFYISNHSAAMQLGYESIEGVELIELNGFVSNFSDEKDILCLGQAHGVKVTYSFEIKTYSLTLGFLSDMHSYLWFNEISAAWQRYLVVEDEEQGLLEEG